MELDLADYQSVEVLMRFKPFTKAGLANSHVIFDRLRFETLALFAVAILVRPEPLKVLKRIRALEF